MQEQLQKIYQLNHFDVTVHRLEERLAAIPTAIATGLQALAETAGQLKALEAEQAELEKTQRAKQADLDDSQAAIKERESKLYQIKTNKEYQAAIHEIAEAKRENKEFEEEILKVMEEIEELKKQADAIRPQVEAKKKAVAEQEENLSAERKELETQLAAEREILKGKMSGIAREFMAKYEVARRRNPDAVAYIERGACQGCYMSLPPQLVIEVQRLTDLHVCPNCQRLLFIRAADEETNEHA